MRATLRVLTTVCLSAALAACKSTGPSGPNIVNISPVQSSLTQQTSPTVVVLGQRHMNHKQVETDFLDCLTNDLASQSAPYSVIPEQPFLDTMYPYFEHSTAPLHIAHISQMVQEPMVAQKLKELNVRYLVMIEGKTQKVNNKGGVSCAIGPGGGGCLGMATWDDEADYAARVWDMKDLTVAGNASTQKSGTSYVPAVIVPIPILSGVQNSACEDLAISINNYLVY